jgi:uncharacterized protein (DUF1697 family)
VRYVALLRGINVGGNNIIRMDALRAAFEALGLRTVTTFIASGNVLFEADSNDNAALTGQIERALATAFAYDSKIVLLSADDLRAAIAEAPPGFGEEPDTYRYDVLFVKPPMTPRKALAEIETTPGVDDVEAGTHALYFRRLTAQASRSRMSKIVGKPVYKSLTIRNWNTTRRLLELVDA